MPRRRVTTVPKLEHIVCEYVSVCVLVFVFVFVCLSVQNRAVAGKWGLCGADESFVLIAEAPFTFRLTLCDPLAQLRLECYNLELKTRMSFLFVEYFYISNIIIL